MSESHTPIRTCIGCRQRASQKQLVRVTVDTADGRKAVVRDDERKLGGRGAWIHRNKRCVEQAITRRAFHRALRQGNKIQLDFELDEEKY